jgi:hypothetical protein
MQPKPIAAGFITADDRRIGRQREPGFRARKFLHQPIGRPGWDLANAGLLPEPGREPEFPRAFTELERQQQRWYDRGRHCSRLLRAGQGHHRYAPLRVVFQGSVTN